MTSEPAARLRMVGPSDRGSPVSPVEEASPTDIPEAVLRFAGLPPEQRRLLLHVHDLLDAIPYGTVVLVMQDGKIIQIETSEKIRLR
jgi:hypothetical protein